MCDTNRNSVQFTEPAYATERDTNINPRLSQPQIKTSLLPVQTSTDITRHVAFISHTSGSFIYAKHTHTQLQIWPAAVFPFCPPWPDENRDRDGVEAEAQAGAVAGGGAV